MQVQDQRQPSAAQTHGAANLCGVTPSAQHWQKQAACDNSSWVDGETVKVTDATTDTTGFNTHSGHLNITTCAHPPTHSYTQVLTISTHTPSDMYRWMKRTHINTTKCNTDLQFTSLHFHKHTTCNTMCLRSCWGGHTLSVAATSCDRAPGDAATDVTKCPWGSKPHKTRTPVPECWNVSKQAHLFKYWQWVMHS